MKKLIILTIMSGLYLSPAFSQVGTIKGTVVNSKSEALAGVEIVFTEEETETFKQTIQSKDNGGFVLTGLKPGHHYTATFTSAGFNVQKYSFKQWIGVNDEAITVTLYTFEEAFVMQGGDLEALAADTSAREFFNNGVNFYKEKKYAESLAAMEKSWEHYQKIDEESESIEELLVIPRFYAIVAFYNQKLDVGLEFCNIYLAKKPDDQNIIELKATIERELAGPSPQELYNDAIAFLNKNDDTNAAVILKKIIAQDPEYALSYFQMGKVMTREFEFEEAIKYYKKFLKLDPKNKLADEAKELIVTLSE